MFSFHPLVAAGGMLLAASTGQGISTSSKRGLVYIPSDQHGSDDSIWDSVASDLTWYYNYQPTPSPAYANSSKLRFVPMLFGADSSATDYSFLDAVTAQIKAGGEVEYVLGFNEPDGESDSGGSNIPVDIAVKTCIREIEPLRKLGVKLGAPVVTGASSGFTWLRNFFSECEGKCSVDFIPVHWYGNFEGLASHIGQVREAYPNMTIWLTEYAYNNVSLEESQKFFNSTTQYFDRIEYITHYSYFGSFRSDVSNVGPNVAMLTERGKLTDIGSWYLGGAETGNIPSGDASRIAGFASNGPLVTLLSIWFFVLVF